MLNAGELEAMRAVQVEAMPDLATIYDRAVTPDGMGGETETFVVRAVDVAVRIGVPRQGPAAAIGDRVAGAGVYVGSLPAGTPVERGDLLIVNGTTYEVQGVDAPQSYETAVRVFLQVVDTE